MELNIGISKRFTVSEALEAVKSIFNPVYMDWRIKSDVQGNWESDESTLIVRFDTDLTADAVTRLTELLGEDAIAYITENEQALAWNPNYSGIKYDFDMNYFTKF